MYRPRNKDRDTLDMYFRVWGMRPYVNIALEGSFSAIFCHTICTHLANAWAEVSRQYRKLALLFHPDKAGGDARAGDEAPTTSDRSHLLCVGEAQEYVADCCTIPSFERRERLP